MIVCAFSEKYQFKKDLVTKIVFFYAQNDCKDNLGCLKVLIFFYFVCLISIRGYRKFKNDCLKCPERKLIKI